MSQRATPHSPFRLRIPNAMQRMGWTSTAALVVFVVAGCQSKPKPDPAPEPSPTTVVDSKPTAVDPKERSKLGGDVVRGTTLTAVAQGPWESRGVGAAGGSGGGRGGGGLERRSEGGGSPMAARSGAMPGAPSVSESMPSPAPPPAKPAGGGSPLRAGSSDDNEHFEAFLNYLKGQDQAGMDAPQVMVLDVSERRSIEVVNASGAPVPGAEVQLLDGKTEELLWRATTYGDGRAPFYPRVFPTASERIRGRRSELPANEIFVVVSKNGESVSASVPSSTPNVVVKFDSAPALPQSVPLDVTFLIDTTGSMSDEIARIKGSLLKVTERLRTSEKKVNLRYGAVLYRDLGDAYVTSRHPLVDDVNAFDNALQDVSAGGGGDFPESMNQGLMVAVSHMNWRPSAAKVVFLIADAPAHTDYDGDVPYQTSATRAVEIGARIHSVAASGLDKKGTLTMRQVAQATRGKFIFIEYGKPGETAKAHGVAQPSASNNLDDILFEQLRVEIDGYGKR